MTRIRQGQSPASLLQYIQTQLYQQPAQVYEQQLRQQFLLRLVQSTAPMDRLVDVASRVFNERTRFALPAEEAYRPLRDRIITLETLGGILKTVNPNAGAIESGETHSDPTALPPSGSYDGPIFWVNARPWTNLTTNDEAVSHLVSMFLTLFNPFWRFVEEDLFLRAMRSGDIKSPFCSPCLVNAILACAANASEIDEAFVQPGDLLTRGEHFHNEAVRLLNSETAFTSLPNMCGMLVLCLESALRGKDRLGLSLVRRAAAANKALPWTSSNAASQDFARARNAAARTVVYINM